MARRRATIHYGSHEIVSAAAKRRDYVFELDGARDHNHDGLRLALFVFEQGVES